MDFRKFIDIKLGVEGVSGFFSAYGSFGIIDGDSRHIAPQYDADDGYTADHDDLCVNATFETDKNGVVIRRDTLTAKKDIRMSRYSSRFLLEGGEYEVYTQYSSWQHESSGAWQELVTGIEISNLGVRTTDGATPMAVLRNKGNGRMFVLHLLPNAQWKIKITKRPLFGKVDGVLIEAGIADTALDFKISAGETVKMPPLIFYTTQNKTDFDAWKLHALFNRLYPRRSLPVLFNTWMYTFHMIDIDDMKRQADAAAELGIDMFLVDAGWFGETENWVDNVGAWVENTEGGFRGRLSELSEYVRSLGLKFGMWIEPERACANVSAVREHPEYFLDGTWNTKFLNYADDGACEYIFNVFSRLIDTYHLSFMKFDFNAPLAYDISGSGFYRYFEGQRRVIARLREKYPDLYITNCASGGTRMDMGQQTVFDSIWISDNQGPVDGLRIFKDTALRLPPSNMEKWDVRTFCSGFTAYGTLEKATLPVSCDGATWEGGVIVKPSYTYGFISGGVMGFSADIARYPDGEKENLKKLIEGYKKDMEFYKNAVMRILHDTENITVLQYSDEDLSQVTVHAFCRYSYQDKLTIYPVLNAGAKYIDTEGKTLNADVLMSDGISVAIEDNGCTMVRLVAVEKSK